MARGKSAAADYRGRFTAVEKKSAVLELLRRWENLTTACSGRAPGRHSQDYVLCAPLVPGVGLLKFNLPKYVYE